jgi:Trypsin
MVPWMLLIVALLFLTPGVASSDDGLLTSNLPVSTRIVGGDDAPGNYPYFILWGGCGATLIHNDIALTAAHCSSTPDAQVGAQTRGDQAAWTNVDRVISHPNYSPETFEYDVAVIRLGGWFEHSTVELNGRESVPEAGDTLTILGFGGEASVLQQGSVNFISAAVCSEQWRDQGYIVDSKCMICAGAGDGDACSGK